MSMTTDIFFYEALKARQEVMDITGGRIYNTARGERDEEEDKIPYVIITFDGLTNDPNTKDGGEGDYDTVNVSLLCVARTRGELATLATEARTAVMKAAYGDSLPEEVKDIAPLSYLLTADGVQYDTAKPCFFQSLHYQTDTYR